MKNLLKNLFFMLAFVLSYFGNSLLQNKVFEQKAQTLYGGITFGGGTFPYANGGSVFLNS
jgi:hypothetical protein